MLRILAKHPTEDRHVIITYLQDGYSEVNLSEKLPYKVTSAVEESFIGASMFGWTAPVADAAHAWACEVCDDVSQTRAFIRHNLTDQEVGDTLKTFHK